MTDIENKTGYFVFSLDTELAWGSLWNQPNLPHKMMDGEKERNTVKRLLQMMDEYGVLSTWAITGHLFYGKCEECEICPILELKGKDSRFDHIWGTQNPIWYGRDMVETLLSAKIPHEIAFHGYTHKLFSKMGRDEAKIEIQEWLRVSKRFGIKPQTVIFPQGGIGHLDLFREAGFICYRGHDVRHPIQSIPILGKLLNQIHLRYPIFTPQAFDIDINSPELLNIPSSQWLFRVNRGLENVLDSVGLQNLRFHETIKSIDNAAQEKKVIHLWAHPQEFRTEKDFEKLQYVFSHFAEKAGQGKLKSITMADLAKQSLEKSGKG